MLPWFLNAEGNARGASALHSAEGPLQVADQRRPRAISGAFVPAAAGMQIEANADFNGPRQDGAGLYQVTQFHGGPRKGERCLTAAAYLHPAMGRANLTVMTPSRALRVTVAGRRATGLLVRRGRQEIALRARRAVILALGAFGSPQVLMLSGIGPEAELRAHGLAVVHDLPGVGQNLQDHLDHTLSWRSLRPDLVGLNPGGLWRLLRAGMDWRRTGEGLFASPTAEAGALLHSRPGLTRPDLQVHFVIGIVDDQLRRRHLADGYSSHICVLRPESRGTVGLTDANPLRAPRIDPAFLSDPRDLTTLMAGARLMERVLSFGGGTGSLAGGSGCTCTTAATVPGRPTSAPAPTPSITRWGLPDGAGRHGGDGTGFARAGDAEPARGRCRRDAPGSRAATPMRRRSSARNGRRR